MRVQGPTDVTRVHRFPLNIVSKCLSLNGTAHVDPQGFSIDCGTCFAVYRRRLMLHAINGWGRGDMVRVGGKVGGG